MDGNRLVKLIADRLEAKNIRCYDTAIISELSLMSQYELEQLIKR